MAVFEENLLSDTVVEYKAGNNEVLVSFGITIFSLVTVCLLFIVSSNEIYPKIVVSFLSLMTIIILLRNVVISGYSRFFLLFF